MSYLNRGENTGVGPDYVYWVSAAPDPTGLDYPAPPPENVPFGQLTDIVAMPLPELGLVGPNSVNTAALQPGCVTLDKLGPDVVLDLTAFDRTFTSAAVTVGAVVGEFALVTPSDGRSRVVVEVSGRDAAGGSALGCSWEIRWIIDREAGVVVVLTDAQVLDFEASPGWATLPELVAVAGQFRARVTGVAGKTINWRVRGRLTEAP